MEPPILGGNQTWCKFVVLRGFPKKNKSALFGLVSYNDPQEVVSSSVSTGGFHQLYELPDDETTLNWKMHRVFTIRYW